MNSKTSGPVVAVALQCTGVASVQSESRQLSPFPQGRPVDRQIFIARVYDAAMSFYGASARHQRDINLPFLSVCLTVRRLPILSKWLYASSNFSPSGRGISLVSEPYRRY